MWRYYIVGLYNNKIYAMAKTIHEARKEKEDIEYYHHIKAKIIDTKTAPLYETQFSGTVHTGEY